MIVGKTILNLGAGKNLLKTNDYPDGTIFQVNVDSIYANEEVEHIINIEKKHRSFDLDSKIYNNLGSVILYSNLDIFEFLNKYKVRFNYIIMHRFLEHVSRSNLQYFLYLLSTVVNSGGIVDIIVPDNHILSRRLLVEEPNSKDWDVEDTILTTEIVNEPNMPHASIWTVPRAYKYIELEGRFKIYKTETPYIFDGRNIYMRVLAIREDKIK